MSSSSAPLSTPEGPGSVSEAPNFPAGFTWAPAGVWTLAEHAAVLNEAPGRIAIRFHARDVNLVMGPAERGLSVPFRVRIDGQLPGAAHGIDVTVSEQRLYQLLRQPKPIADRHFEIGFLESGVEAFAFTFG
jgi:Thioredoxin like C-terminal domain